MPVRRVARVLLPYGPPGCVPNVLAGSSARAVPSPGRMFSRRFVGRALTTVFPWDDFSLVTLGPCSGTCVMRGRFSHRRDCLRSLWRSWSALPRASSPGRFNLRFSFCQCQEAFVAQPRYCATSVRAPSLKKFVWRHELRWASATRRLCAKNSQSVQACVPWSLARGSRRKAKLPRPVHHTARTCGLPRVPAPG